MEDPITLLRRKPRKLCGIYFLFAQDELIYIGASINIRTRVETHFSQGVYTPMKHGISRTHYTPDEYAYIKCNYEELSDIEYKYIQKHKPLCNSLKHSKYQF